MSLDTNLREMELASEAYWLRYPSTSPIKLRWRALTLRHCFHVLPGESILELGAGSGLWTKHLDEVLRHENPVAAVFFDERFEPCPLPEDSKLVKRIHVRNLGKDLPAESFDYVVGNTILSHDQYGENLKEIHRLLRPGGSFLFFEANHWNPQVWIKNHIRPIGRWAGQPQCQIGMRRYPLMQIASHQGFTHLEAIPYDIVHPAIPRRLVRFIQSLAFVFEHMPVVKEMCGTLYFWGRKPGDVNARRPKLSLATHRELFGSTSVVVPCHNEEMNIALLVDELLKFYGDYIREIILVNDNSKDRTAQVAEEVAGREPRVRLINRQPPNGVGLALRDGYAAATGKYILTMDCDFVQILPEFRDLFDKIAEGFDGAIGSRFTHDSIMVNYPFLKILANRSFHVLVRLVLGLRVRDISNNLKLYRTEIFRNVAIDQPGFAANAETGLKPKLAGYRTKEVPVSWINRSFEMGSSSFRIVKVAPGYARALLGLVWKGLQQKQARKRQRKNIAPAAAPPVETNDPR